MVKRLRDRIEHVDPLWKDLALAVGLTLLTCLELWLLGALRPNLQPPGISHVPRFDAQPADWTAYLLAAAAFMPLTVRGKAPWVAFALSVTAAIAYSATVPAPAPTVLAPMIAIYTVALHARRKRSGLVGVLVAGLVIAAGLFVFSPTVRWVAEVMGPIVLLTAAALLGESERNRREYVAEFERRTLEAERTREEEARRRVDEERIRIARDVHDIVAHSLSIVTVQASAAAALLDGSPQAARESIENVRTTGKQALAELRSMLDVLRTSDTSAPLAPAAHIGNVVRLAHSVREAGIEVDLRVSGDLDRVPAYAGVSAYRIVQETLTNVVRHSGARRVNVVIDAGEDALVVEITDHGTSTGAGPTRIVEGHGIRGMRERVDALGGAFEMGPAETGGLRVRATIPLARIAS